MINKLWDNFPLIKEDLIICQNILHELIEIPNEDVKNAVKDVLNSDAKMVRPALLLMFARATKDEINNDLLTMAAAVELLHTATLIHDDIIDNSDTRRGKPSLHKLFGNSTSVYAGDFMLSKSYEIVLKHGKTLKNCEFIAKKVKKILAGELTQMKYRGNFNITEDILIDDIISGKTASLIAISCYEGVYLQGGSKEECLNAYTFGHSLGIAFQLIDDIIDITGDKKIANKPINHDFMEGYFTLPIIKSFESHKEELVDIYSNFNEKSYMLKNILKKTKGIEYTRKLALYHTSKAKECISNLKDSTYKSYLERILNKMLKRVK